MPDFDTQVRPIARIYDYWLGGKDNYAADREAAELAMAATPTIVPGVRASRRFLGRAVHCIGRRRPPRDRHDAAERRPFRQLRRPHPPRA
ncbi:MAG: SAM-dependent methyltransferase [Actinomycetota bacterium]